MKEPKVTATVSTYFPGHVCVEMTNGSEATDRRTQAPRYEYITVDEALELIGVLAQRVRELQAAPALAPTA